MIPWLNADSLFPPVERALQDPNGLLAAGGDLHPERVLEAYRHGIFPWYGEGQPILWWSPDPRTVLYVSEFRISKSLRKHLKIRTFTVATDTRFADVIVACAQTARPGQSGTWITSRMENTYNELHQSGHAHSVEVFSDGELVGGLYGLAIGRVFFGESMFSRKSDASKVALAMLVGRLRELDIPLVDCQQETPHLLSLGARAISRPHFLRHLSELIPKNADAVTWTRGPIQGMISE